MSNPLSPERERDLAKALAAYTEPSSDEYDPEFTAWLQAHRPDWFQDEPGDVEPGDDE